jgi:rsbT antagonist protein RsbS
MPAYSDTPRVAIQVSRGVVVASIQLDLEEGVLARFRADLLSRIHQTGACHAILDVSGLETLDSSEFASLRQIIKMTAVMGAQSVLVGLRPGVVSALIEAGADIDGLYTACDLDAAFARLQTEPQPARGAAIDEEPGRENERSPNHGVER